jgi:membrane-anchored protein YejM (alkaline phosphatase superfamily)
VDSLVGEALATLEQARLLERSLLIITGDHGQEFNDNGQNYWGHGSNFTRFQTGVPFLMYAPNLAPEVYEHRTTHFDVMPTLMRNYLGCDEPFATYSVGRSLFEPGGRETIVMSEYADFAILHHNQTAIVREQGMEVRDANYLELEVRPDPRAIAAALEQKTRFAGGGLPSAFRSSKRGT